MKFRSRKDEMARKVFTKYLTCRLNLTHHSRNQQDEQRAMMMMGLLVTRRGSES